MHTLIKHGVLPLKVPAAVAEMEKEATAKLKGAVVCLGSKNTNDPDFNESKDLEAHHISVETYWEKAPDVVEAAPTRTERVRGK